MSEREVSEREVSERERREREASRLPQQHPRAVGGAKVPLQPLQPKAHRVPAAPEHVGPRAQHHGVRGDLRSPRVCLSVTGVGGVGSDGEVKTRWGRA